MPTEGEWSYDLGCYGHYRLFGGRGEEIGEVYGFGGSEDHARRIVTAVNCHEELVGLVEEICNEMDATDNELSISTTANWFEILERCDAVLAKAREGEA